MACFTRIEILLDDTALNRLARKKLGLPETGRLDRYDADRVKIEAGFIKAKRAVLRADPTAIVTRKGNKLKVTISR